MKQITSNYIKVNQNIIAFHNVISIKRNNITRHLNIITPRHIDPNGQIHYAYNYEIQHQIANQKTYTQEQFELLYLFNCYLVTDFYRANSEPGDFRQKFRSLESFFSEEDRINILIEDDCMERYVDFKLNNIPTEDFKGIGYIYTNKKNQLVPFSAYDYLSAHDPAIRYFQKLVDHIAFNTLQESLEYYGVKEKSELDTYSVQQMLCEYKFDKIKGSIEGYRKNYSQNTDDIAFLSYIPHINQYHQVTNQLSGADYCIKCEFGTCSMRNVRLHQPQLMPVSQLKVYPYDQESYDTYCQLYSTLVHYFKIWCAQSSIKKITGFQITDESINTSLSNSFCNYESLELLGDSVLKFVVSVEVYQHSELNEGQLTNLRSQLINNNYLSSIFDATCFENYIINSNTRLFRNPVHINKHQIPSTTLEKSQKADIYEALCGDVFNQSKSLQEFIQFLRITNFPISDKYNAIMQYEFLDFKTKIQENYPEPQKFTYEFQDISLFNEALSNYERLEFLGDAALELLVISKLFHELRLKYHNKDYMEQCRKGNLIQKLTPGRITDLKKELLDNNFMGMLAIQQGLIECELPKIESHSDIPNLPKHYGDRFESVAAAILFDGGWSALNKTYGKLYEPYINYYLHNF